MKSLSRLLAVLGISSTLMAALPARAQCPATLESSLYAPATDLAKTWTVLDILFASNDGEQPQEWLPSTIQAPDGTQLQNEGEDPSSLTANGATPEERWKTAFSKALERFHEHAMKCTPAEFVGLDSLQQGWASDTFGDPTALEALENYAQQTQPRSVLIARSVGHLGGLPATRPILLSLSQTISRGQPGFAPSLSVSPFTLKQDPFVRHLMFSASTLVINPDVALEEGEPVKPIVASIDGSLGTSSAARVDDWYNEVTSHLPENVDRLNQIRKDTLRRVVEDYRAASPGDGAEQRRDVLSNARSKALNNFQQDVFTYYRARYIQPYEDKKTVFDWSLSVRARYTRDATWVAEVADLAAVGLDGAFDYHFAEVDGFKFSASGGLLLSSSWYPTALGWTRPDTKPEGVTDSGWGALADANLGLTLFVPAESDGSTLSAARLSILGLARGEARSEVKTVRFGFHATLEVPVSDRVTLAGAFTLRCQGKGVCASSSGLTFAVAGLD